MQGPRQAQKKMIRAIGSRPLLADLGRFTFNLAAKDVRGVSIWKMPPHGEPASINLTSAYDHWLLFLDLVNPTFSIATRDLWGATAWKIPQHGAPASIPSVCADVCYV